MAVRKTTGSMIGALLAMGLATSSVPGGAGAMPRSAVLVADTGNAAAQTGRIVDDDPASFTPHVMDGAVHTMTRVGDYVIVGGSFSRVRNAGSSADIARRNLFAFHVSTGQVSTTFAPDPDSTVYSVEPAADGTSVYVGGAFGSVRSASVTVPVSRLYRANVLTGDRVAQFQPGTLNGQVRDISVVGQHLWIAGKFTHVQGQARRALATIDATTGARDPFYSREIAGAHRAGSVTNIQKIATSPDNSRLVAIGNFDTVDGVRRHQLAMLDIGGPAAALSDYTTPLFESPCSSAFETYMTDVQFSPDGTFFVVSTTGAYGGYAASMDGTSGCDVVARFESGSSGPTVRPTWTSYTGGDTTWTVEVTDDVVYAGGHQRWQNNPARGDAPDEGAVSRPGIAALDTVNGMPYSWNPTRTLGAGVRDLLATPQGLFVGSDTDVIAGETHRKVAFLPLASGALLPSRQERGLPADVYGVASGQAQLVRRAFDGSQVTSTSAAPNGSGWGTTVGAFMVHGDLYTAYSSGALTRRTFDGTSYGAATPVDAADQLVLQDDWHNTDVRSITTLFRHGGWLYFTLAGSSELYRRGFEPESGVVGQQRFSVPSVSGVSYATMRGAFVSGGQLYFANASGALSRANWGGHGAVSSTAVALPSAGGGWSSRALFVYQGPPVAPPVNDPPTAAFVVWCSGLTCTFDAGASDDPDGTVDRYDWSFGDGAVSASSSDLASHTYGAGGAVTVTLTVTDDDGGQDTTTRTAQPTQAAAALTMVEATSTAGNRVNHRVVTPSATRAGDLLLLYLVANTTVPTYTAPAGWVEIEAAAAGTKAVGRLYRRVATAADSGGTVTVVSSAYAKSVASLVVYRSEDGSAPTVTSAVAVQTSSGATHVTPTLTAPDGAATLVSYWADKSGETTAWTLPPGHALRSTASGTGSGHVSAVLADSGGPVPAGPRGGLTATADASGTAAVTFSVLVAP